MTPSRIVWRKSSFSVNGSDCVELADATGSVLMRDSKHPDDGYLVFTGNEVAAFVASAKMGELDDLML